ncbi:RICIN domain-containing protein [Tunturiibacter gelidoferens]|uniref:Uncharacterized protein n=1 Tax=Tunturiibacter gelidiferens TaxID=3069689 RepID=A0ACC5NVF2_9BACT|nr:RICIN domain-containing protein [Edaphobacter lichenicola]MBB5338435.1 hypothetical protein [Edaphobacter lichenicola]
MRRDFFPGRAGLRSIFLLVAAVFAGTLPLMAQTDVLTWHNDVARTGQNLRESLLTPAVVNSASFGLLANVVVDGKVDAQPLYASAVAVAGQGTHNILYVATEHDSLYAIDGDTGKIYWRKSMLGAGETTSDDRSCSQVVPEIGITATPVIDRGVGGHGTIFVVAMSKDSSGNYYHRVHSLDMSSGAEQKGSPVTVSATYPGVGRASSGGKVVFDPKQYKDRPALLVLSGTLYTTWGSHCDAEPYAGWIISYNERTLAQTAVFNFAPNGSEAAPWNAGAGPAADTLGNVYISLGNGTFDTTLNSAGMPGKGDYGNSMLKLHAATLMPLDYWTMYNTGSESGQDVDLGSGGLMLLPDQKDATGKVRHLAVAAGKDGNLYVADRDNMGHYDATNDGTIYQQLTGALAGGVWSSPAYFNERVYYGPQGHNLMSFPIAAARLGSTVQTTATGFPYPGTTPSISAYGTTNAIVWAVDNRNPALLHAYDAGNLSTEFYNSSQAAAGRDHFGAGNKFITPTVVNGKVYVATTNSVGIFGLIRKTPALVADGDYTLVNSNSGLALEDPSGSKVAGTAMCQAVIDVGSDQKWFLSYDGQGYYRMQNVSSAMFLTDPGSSSSSGISLEQELPASDASQLWSLTAASGGGYVITNKATGLVFDVINGTKTVGPYVDLETAGGVSNQTWLLK